MASSLLTRELAVEAVQLVLPSLEALLEKRGKRPFFHIVILDPTVHPWNAGFEDAILYEYSIRADEWDNDYKAVARSKAYQTWRDGRHQANWLTHELGPASIEPGDAEAWSSFNWYGLTVAGSGIQRWLDYLVGGWVALACQMLCRDELESIRADPNQRSFP